MASASVTGARRLMLRLLDRLFPDDIFDVFELEDDE